MGQMLDRNMYEHCDLIALNLFSNVTYKYTDLLTYLLMWHYNQYLIKACWRRSLHDCLSWRTVLWPLGPGYRCYTHPPTWISVFLDFSFQWVWLWIEHFVVGLRVLWSCDQRSANCLSSWHLGQSDC
jgi:hypothetical protein